MNIEAKTWDESRVETIQVRSSMEVYVDSHAGSTSGAKRTSRMAPDR